MSKYDMSRGGVWLGAARKWMQWNKRNGSTVTWSSAEELRPSVTVREAEDMARRVAEAVYEEMDGEVTRLREALEQVDGDVARRCAEAVAPLITALVHVVEECREEYCNVASGGPSACVVCSIARAALAAGKREGG